MLRLTEQQRELMIAALELALGTWDKAPENDQLNPIFDHLVKAGAESNVVVMGAWSPAKGDCYECGLPAAYRVPDAYGRPNDERPETLRCSVCAAHDAAVDGERIVYLFDE